MTVEVATYVADLQPVNPPATDPRAQGDDHLRLIKQVLQNTFGGASRQFQIPGVRFPSTSYSVTKADGESSILGITTSGPITLTLPALVAGDIGWKISVIKVTSDANPIFIVPPAGTVNSGGSVVTKARRCIPWVASLVIWDGTNWNVTRALALPIGACIEFHGSSLPAGYEWPNGQTLSSAANYPEYNAVMGGLTTLDKRGRIGITLDNLGGAAAGRLSGGFITGTAVGNTGGVDGVTLSTGQIPAHQHGVFVTVNDPGHTHNLTNGTAVLNQNVGGVTWPGGSGGGTLNITVNTAFTNITVSIGSSAGLNDHQTALVGGGGSHSNLQPSLMVASILVVE